MHLVPFENIVAAAHRIRGHVRMTPLQPSARLSAMLSGEVFMKMENMQHTGAYKERGALNKLLSLTPEQRARGVCAASAGNHAQGLAYHAGRLGITATVFMPLGTPVIKVTRTQEYGAKVKLVGRDFDEAFASCLTHCETEKSTLVHPFDDQLIIAGQGTIGLEMLDQNSKLDTLVVPVGGGGMISGIARAAREINPNIQIIGVEPAKIPSMAKFLAGDTSIHAACTTIADGINVRKVGTHTAAMCRDLVHRWVTVTEEELCRAMLFLLEGEKCVAEGAGAAGVAALLAGKIDTKGKTIGTVICGGNVDVNVMAQVIECGLVDTGRRVRLSMELQDRPGSLSKLMMQIAEAKANVVSVSHERTRTASFGTARVQMTLDVRGAQHAKEIFEALSPQFAQSGGIRID